MIALDSANLLEGYKKVISSYDEVLDKKGQAKPYWQSMFASLQEIGVAELGSRQQEIIRMLRENGVTYNVYESPNGLNRPWQLDAIPFIIEQSEWDNIAKGL